MLKSLHGLLLLTLAGVEVSAQQAHIRVNQAGYLPEDHKIAIAFANQRLAGEFTVKDAVSSAVVHRGQIESVEAPGWGSAFSHYHKLDFSAVTSAGRYVIEIGRPRTVSRELAVGPYPGFHEDLLHFMRQQRCGYNPFLDAACHRLDGRSFYAPFPDESFVDASGGWHDAGDQLKYLITASNASARMMLAYELQKAKFGDFVDALGRANRPNGVPDVLDEVRWGLDWIHKLHPKPGQLFHQVADDRDHRGFKIPNEDNADYGWGPNSYRPVYFANGEPQGLSEFQSQLDRRGEHRRALVGGDGDRIPDLANRPRGPGVRRRVPAGGRDALRDGAAAERGGPAGQLVRLALPLQRADLGRRHGVRRCRALQGRRSRRRYLDDAIRYARIAATTSWMEFEDSSMGELMSRHYQMYPFTNVGHYALYPLVDDEIQGRARGLLPQRHRAHRHAGPRPTPTAWAFRSCGARTTSSSRSSRRCTSTS